MTEHQMTEHQTRPDDQTHPDCTNPDEEPGIRIVFACCKAPEIFGLGLFLMITKISEEISAPHPRFLTS
jgi:hypothetical protein